MSGNTETVKVRWITTVIEVHEADIPRDELLEMVNSGTQADDLAEYEVVALEVSVIERDIVGGL